MKTYFYTCMFIACFSMGCSEEGVGDKIDESPRLMADYTVLLQKDGVLKTTLLNADSDGITVNPAQSDFEEGPAPELIYRNGSKMGFYMPKEDCSANIVVHNFSDDAVVHTTVFTEDLNCDLHVKSIAFSGNKALVAYVVPSDTKKDGYFLRILDLTVSPSSFIDVALTK